MINLLLAIKILFAEEVDETMERTVRAEDELANESDDKTEKDHLSDEEDSFVKVRIIFNLSLVSYFLL